MENKNSNTSFISGKFSVLHAGHVKLFKFAKTISDRLIVGVYSDQLLEQTASEPVSNRVMALVSNKFVDEVVIIDNSVVSTLYEFKPNLVIKGVEHKNKFNVEQEYIDATDSEIIFSSGATVSLPNNFSKIDKTNQTSFSQWIVPTDFISRHNLSYDKISRILDLVQETSVLIVGDSILDRYTDCIAIGMSQEDPIIVASPTKTQNFIGGAAIVAAHAQSMGANAKLLTLLGEDAQGDFISEELESLEVKLEAYKEIGRPTTTKTRYRISGKSVFRLNELYSDDCGQFVQESILDKVTNTIKHFDMLIFSDFNYGMLPTTLVEQIEAICAKNSIPIIADSQSSSQLGNITRFKNAKLVTPTEYEARTSLHNKEDGLVRIAEQIRESVNSDYVFLKLGKDGLIIHNSHHLLQDTIYLTDQIPALYKSAIDTAGAGDSLMVASSLMLNRGASIWEAALIGSIAAGIQVSRNGNIPISANEIKPILQYIFGNFDS